MKKLFLIWTLFLFVVLNYIAFSEGIDESDVKSQLPKMLGANNVGKEFWFTIPPCYEETAGNNFIRIYVTSPYRTLVTVEVPGTGYYKTKMTIPNDVIEFPITPTEGQPYVKAPWQKEVPDQIFPGAGIHVFADYPLVVYVVVRYRATSDGFLAIPVSSLGKEYIVAGYPVDPMFKAVWNYYLPNLCGIVAPYDQTKVRITLGGNSLTKTAGGHLPGQTREIVLNRGDVYMISTEGDGSDLTGTRIVANKPVGVVTGNQCNNIPNGNQWCDYTVEMDLPTFTWGYDYHIPNTSKIPRRKYSPLLRIFAKEKNTTIYRDGKEFAFLRGSNGLEGNGWLETRMNPAQVPYAHYPVVISGDKPIGVTLYNPGVQEDGYPHPNSDPFVMVMTPLQQYQKEITFCTPATFGGARFAENYITLVYQTDSLGLTPDDLEFAEVKSGQFVWKKINVLFPGVDDLYNYDVDGKKFAMKVIPLAKDGVYKIRAKNPFAAYSYGFDSYDSYGYPTSAALADLEKPDTLPPVPKWQERCGEINFATVTDMPDDPAIRSNMGMIVLHPYPESFNVKFSYTDFIPGEARTVAWKLEVEDKTQDARAVITFSDRRGNDTTITIEYKAVKLTIRPGEVKWGLLKLGSNRVSKEFWAINESEQSGVLVTELKLKANNQNFELDMMGRSLPFWLGPKDSVKFLVWFNPTANGTFADSIGIGDTCVFAYKSYVEAQVGQPMIEVSDVHYGSVRIGRTVTKQFTIKNPGTTDLHIWGYRGPSNTVYKTNLPPVDVNNRMSQDIVIKAGDELQYSIDFTPTAEVDYPDEIVFFSDADEWDSVCVISGRGIQPGLESNSYDWGRKRIDRSSHPAGPYPVASGDVIKLVNSGSDEVLINGLIIVEDINGDAFEFDRRAFDALKIAPKDSVVIPVVFHPRVVGVHRLRIKFENSANSQTETVLEGIGIVGRLKTVDLVFDPMVVFDEKNKQVKTMYIENEQYEWSDYVDLTDLVVTPSGAIAVDGVSYGSEGFGYDKSSLGLPVRLQPGERITFDGYFVAQKVPQAVGRLTTVSDAESEVTSTWTGSGISLGIGLEGGSAKICVGDRTEISCKVKNTALGDLTIHRLYLSGDYTGVTFSNPVDALGFTLAAGEEREIKLLYQPMNVETKRIWLVAENNTLDRPVDSVSVDLEAVQYKGLSRIAVVKPTIDRAWPVPGDRVPVEVQFTTSDNLTLAQVKELVIRVSHLPGILKVDESSIEVGSALQGRFTIKSKSVDPIAGTMEVRLEATAGNILNQSGQILRFVLDSYLPTDRDSTDYSKLEVDVEAIGTQCVVIDDEGSEIKLQPTCVYDLRLVSISNVKYYLAEVVPNPVSGANLDLNFAVAFDGWTELDVVNSMGEVVKRVVTGEMRSGEYTVRVDVSDLGSGLYLVRLRSGHYTESKPFTISK